ncbi:MAG: hypothetical protein V8R75_14240 [Oscillospiraceae bacterium]
MSGFVLFNPLLGRRNIPGIFRGGLILTLSVFVFSVTEQKVDVPGRPSSSPFKSFWSWRWGSSSVW